MPRSKAHDRSGILRVLGLDPGLTRTGYAVIVVHNRKLNLKAYGCIFTEKIPTYGERLLEIESRLTALIQRHRPTNAALEQLFVTKNLKTAIAVGQARGVAVLTLARARVPVAECTPQQVKIAVTGYGRADKQQVQRMVQRLFHLQEIPKPDDAADAIAVAVAATLTLQTRIRL